MFVILSAPRSGSNMLCSLLDSHPNIICHHELFNPAGILTARSIQSSPDQRFDFSTSVVQRNAEPHTLLDELRRQDQWQLLVGFKMTGTEPKAIFDTVLSDPAITKIVLYRRQPVRMYVSRLFAEQSGIWEDYFDQSTLPTSTKTVIDMDELQQAMEENCAFYRQIENSLQATNQKAITLDYSELQSATAHCQLLNALGQTCEPLRASSRQRETRDLCDMVENYAELYEYGVKTLGVDFLSELRL